MVNTSIDCIIVEDDPIDRDLLVEYIDRHDDARLLWACETAEDAEERLVHGSEDADLVLLDINLPGKSGFDVIRETENPPVVVVASSDANYAVQAFDIEAADFLVKPVSYERFDAALTRAQTHLQAQPPSAAAEKDQETVSDQTIFVNTGDQYVRLSLPEVLYLESDGNYLRIHMEGGACHLVRLTLKRAGEVLPTRSFVRVHRSYMLRIDQIENVVDWSAVVDGDVIPVSESYRETLMDVLPTLA